MDTHPPFALCRNDERSGSTVFNAVSRFVQGLILAAGILALLLLPSLSSAEGPSFKARTGLAGRANLEGDGSYKSETYGLDASWEFLYLEYTHTTYHWKDSSRIGFSRGHKPWRDLDFVRLGARGNGQLEVENLGWFADGGLIMGWEEQLRGSFGLAGSGGLTYQFNPEFKGKLGAWVMAHPALFRVLPVASLDWKDPSDPGPSASLGFPETMLRYNTEQGITLRAGARADLGDRTHRLADNSQVYRKGYISTTGVTAGAYVDFTPAQFQGLTATVGLEYDMERAYEIRSSSGNRKRTIDVDNTPSLQFSIGYAF